MDDLQVTLELECRSDAWLTSRVTGQVQAALGRRGKRDAACDDDPGLAQN